LRNLHFKEICDTFMLKFKLVRNSKSKRFVGNFNLLNVLLISATVFFALHILFPTLDFEVKYKLPAAKLIKADTGEKPAQSHPPSITEYMVIAEENLFHPERKIPPEKKEEQPLPKPEFVLYGTLITDDMSLAYLEDLKAPRNSPGRGKRQVAMKKGDSMSGFTLKEIETDKIVMLRGEEKLVVPINNPAHPKTREAGGATTRTATEKAAATQAAAARATAQPGSKPRNFQPGATRSNQPATMQPPQVAPTGQAPTSPPSAPPPSSIRRKGGFGALFDLPR
jgi:hypothetical protein